MFANSFSIKKILLAVSFALPPFAFAAPLSTSAYNTDPQQSHVEDATSDGIGSVNMITCFMSSMRPDALVNQGNYVALVDKNKCDPKAQSSTSNSGSSGGGSQAANYMSAIVNSSRASNSDPMIAKIWVSDVEQDHSATIFVHTAATQAPTSTNPYGIFRMDFCGHAMDPNNPGQLLPSCMMNGYLEGATNGLSYYEADTNPNSSQTTALQLNATGTDTGSGRLDMLQTQNNVSNEQIFSFAYNHDYFLRGDQCFSRDANQADFSVWNYGVYDANTGDRVVLNSGFPIQYTPSSGTQTYQGYLGYYGLTLPPDAMTALGNEASPVIKKVDYTNGSATATNYSVVKASGKLTKYTKQTRTLKQIDQIKFNIFVSDATALFNGATSNTQYEMYWDDASGAFIVDGSINCNGGNGCQTASLNPVQSVSPSFWSAQSGVQGWSQSLGGELFIDLHGVSLPLTSSAVQVVYRTQDLMYPSDMPGTLYCLRDCPTSASLASYFAPNAVGQSPFTLANNWNDVVPGQQVTYATNATTGVLMDAQSQPVTFTDSNALANHPQYQNGIASGRLFTAADLAAVACDDQPSDYCDYKVNSINVYYVWETGSNSWNQFAAVKDTNNQFVKFDAPMQLNYQVPSDSVKYGQYAGASIVLQYGGFGNLGGIPGECVSQLTNAPVSCDQPNARYVPAFAIPAGSQVTAGSNTYLVKWLDREIRFARKDPSDGVSCAGLTVPANGGISLPTAATLKDPSAPSSDIYIGTKPTLDAAPRVIQGTVEY